MAYVSFTLKYRPSTFADVVGQEHVTRTLRNAVETGRIAHAYLFSGPRGTGKTSCARILAKSLNCETGPTAEPCGVCGPCVSIRDGRALDIVEIDAASNRGIDEIRDLREKVKYSPAEFRYKLYILDEVHMLTTEAFNALLKTLEEPPAHAYFVLATTEPHRVPATIVSRCQRFDFRRIGVPDIVGALGRIAQAEGIDVGPEALAAIARAADGGMRDSQSIFDQLVAYSGQTIELATVNEVLGATDLQTLTEIVGAILSADHAQICGTVDQLIAHGKDLGQLLDDLMLYARDLARVSLQCEPIGPVAGSPDEPSIVQQSQALGAERAMALMTHLAKVRQEFRRSTQHALLLETALLEATVPATSTAAAVPAPQPVVAPPAQQPAPQPAVGRPAPEQPSIPPPVQQMPGPRPSETPTPPVPQPVGASQPPPAAAPVASGLTLDFVVERWDSISGVLRGMRRTPIVAVLREGKPAAVAGNRLTISFGPKHGFHHGKVAGEYREVIQEAATQALGTPVEIEAVLSDDAPAPEVTPHAEIGPPPDPGMPAASDSPALQDIQDVFPGSRLAPNDQPS